MENDTIIVRGQGAVAHLAINRPKSMNAFNLGMIAGLRAALRAIEGDPAYRALVISGEGGNFAAGADIDGMVGQEPVEARKRTFNQAYHEVENFSLPVIAAIEGYALGGGLELALACDLRVCGPTAKLGFPEIRLGIFPGAGGTQRLAKLIGPARAKEMIYFGDSIDARTALSYGLCSRVVEGDPVREALAMAGTLAARPAAALQYAKRAVNFGIGRDIRTGVAYEEEAWSALFSTADQKEGMRAFLEKRKPEFEGL